MLGRMRWALLALLLVTGLLAGPASAQEPPFTGTAFIEPGTITASDPSAYKSIKYAGRGKREVFDRRKGPDGRFITINAFLFTATYADGGKLEAQVNPEFGSRATALTQARKYARVIGLLPRVLRGKVKALFIHKGNKDYGGGQLRGVGHIVIHVGRTPEYERDGVLEEILVHEATHVALDPKHAEAAGWRSAQKADPTFISTYARDYSDSEDVAESFLPWLALRYRRDRMDEDDANTVQQTMPNRLAYFDRQKFNVAPLNR